MTPPPRWLTVPALLTITGVFAYPLLRAAWLSLQALNLNTQLQPVFIGLANYQRLWGDSRFWNDLFNTSVFTSTSVSLELVLGLAIALLLHQPSRWRGPLRTIALLPWVLPTAVMALGWAWIFNDPYGVWNDWLQHLGWIAAPINWLGNPRWAWLTLVAADVWKTTPFVAILLLAGRQAIPEDLYEAHRLEGATAWQSFWQITLPLLRPQLAIALLFRSAQAFGLFDLVKVMTGGGPANSTETLALYAYTTALRYLDFGYGATLAIVTAAILAAGLGLIWGLGRSRSTPSGGL
ncbi:carbohydrate ABC transporter permease [Synechococcus elongatus]|uniref:carbohydrate ABC transporter permease n=1 Tax=Synechococcus elongatus TaxID=32046 RepID=UPI000F7EBBCD|nr:sugar ABC transporter permease [Synechococcus elongatus]